MMIRLHDMANREFACTYSGNFTPGISGRWQWIVEQVAERFNCDPDDVSTADTDDDLGLLVVKGEPVGRIVREYGLVAS